jgi:peroxiredoxin Q/BCP
MIKVGQEAPDIRLEADDGTTFDLAELRGQKVLLVFYPGDNTPVCTRQLCDYRDGAESFEGLGVTVVGISKDGPESHLAFKEKHGLPFMLLSDPDLAVAADWGAKGMLGMKRATFLVDEQGIVAWEFVESLAVFRRSREELIEAIGGLSTDEEETS